MIRQGYKVVERTQEREYCSAIISRRVYYKLHEWVYPIGGDGPLCVFKTFLDAHQFLLDYTDGSFVIMVCDYEPSALTSVWNSQNPFVRDLEQLPVGTVLADRVKLVCLTYD